MGRRININGKNVECRLTGKRIPVKRKPERDTPIHPYKMPETIYEGYRYHRRGKYTKANGATKTFISTTSLFLYLFISRKATFFMSHKNRIPNQRNSGCMAPLRKFSCQFDFNPLIRKLQFYPLS